MSALQSGYMQRIFTELKPKSGWLKGLTDIIKLCNETKEDIQLMVAPDPNQVVLMKIGGDVSGGVSGAGISCNAVRQFVPRDARTCKKSLKPGAVEVLRLPSDKVYVTVLRNYSLKEWDTDIVMMKGDTLRVYIEDSG